MESTDLANFRANPPVLMSEPEVAVFLGVCERSVRNFTTRKLLPVIRLGRRRLYRRDAVLAALAKMEEGTPVEHPVIHTDARPTSKRGMVPVWKAC